MAGVKIVPTSSNDVTETWLKTVLEKDNPATKVKVVSLNQITEVNGLLAAVFKASVKFNNDTDETRLFIKIGVSEDNPYASFTLTSQVDIKEVHAYEDDIAGLVAFEKECLGKSQLEQSLPKIYASGYDASDGNRGIYIVMEDLTVNHKMVNYLDGLSKDQMMAAVESIARFHALSYCYYKSNGKPYPQEKKPVYPLLVEGQEVLDLYNSFKDLAIKDLSDLPSGKHLIPYIKDMFVDFKSFFLKAMTFTNDTFLIHGDLWSNNVMFNISKEDGLTKGVKLFDWQFFCYGPPCVDFTLLVVTGLTPENNEAWIDELYDAYFNKLESTFKEFKMEAPFTKEQFIQDCYKIGFITTFDFLMTSYDPLWRKKELIDRFIWILDSVIKHRPDLFTI